MRRNLYILVLALVLPVWLQAAPPARNNSKNSKGKAKTTKIQDLHFVSMWGGVGYSGLVNNYSAGSFDAGLGKTGSFDSRFIGGGGGLIGVGYELHHGQFMFSVGPELRLFSSEDRMGLSPFQVGRSDYATMTQNYSLQRFRETQTVGQLMVPILFGGDFDRYYFMAGVKVGYTLFGTWRQRGTLVTSVSEQRGLEDWIDIPPHNLYTEALADHPLYEGTDKGKNSWGLDVALSGEFGVNLNEFFHSDWQTANEDSRHPWHTRLGVFIDYGMPMLSAKTGEGVSLATVDGMYESDAQPAMMHTQSLHQSTFADSRLSSLLVGVKLTALWQVNKPRVPNPRIVFVVTDTLGNPTKTQASVEVFNTAKPKQKAKVRNMGKGSQAAVRYAKSTYAIVARAAGYLPSDYAGDTLRLIHTADLDTVRFSLIAVPRLVCYVHDLETEHLISAQMQFSSRQSEGHNRSLTSSAEAPAVVGLHYGDKFDLHLSANGYHDTTAVVDCLTDTVHYYLRPIHIIHRTLLLKHIYFATDKADILPISEPELVRLYTFLDENPEVRILITGHTDSQGSDMYNQVLSEKRAASVKAEMVKRGIAADRMETNGKGESEPIDTNDTEEGRQNNRRVQVTVLSGAKDIIE